MINKEYLYIHALNSVVGIGPQKLELLLNYFKSSEDAWNCTDLNHLLSAGFSKKLAHKFLLEKQKVDINKQLDILEKNKISVITKFDNNYPTALKNIYGAPVVLYVKGDTNILNEPSVTIVGSRKFTSYGERVTQKIVSELTSANINIVSGLAIGIDAISHKTCLKSKGDGKTIAVLGGGIDSFSIAPRINLNLSNDILSDGGVLLSSFVPLTKPSKGTFPARNRIMTGISKVTVAVEAEENSGTLVTAKLAQEFNKTLFAVPGSIFSKASVGTNNLIKNGFARSLQDASDILNLFSIDTKQKK